MTNFLLRHWFTYCIAVSIIFFVFSSLLHQQAGFGMGFGSGALFVSAALAKTYTLTKTDETSDSSEE